MKEVPSKLETRCDSSWLPMSAWRRFGCRIGSASARLLTATGTVPSPFIQRRYLHPYDGVILLTKYLCRLVWNWQLNEDYYPEWSSLVSEWAFHQTRVLTYINPFFSNPEGVHNYSFPSVQRNLYAEGVEHSYFVKNAYGRPYLLRSGSIEFHMVDLTHPLARRWMKDIMKEHMIRYTHSSGMSVLQKFY